MGRYGARWEGVLGSFLEVQLLAPPWRARRAFGAVLREVRRLEAVFSRHRESELTRLVRQGGGRPSPEMREVLAAALALKEATGGAFHPAPAHGGEAFRFVGEEVEVRVEGQPPAGGSGKSRKEAEMLAAAKAISLLSAGGGETP